MTLWKYGTAIADNEPITTAHPLQAPPILGNGLGVHEGLPEGFGHNRNCSMVRGRQRRGARATLFGNEDIELPEAKEIPCSFVGLEGEGKKIY
jgi:hypothetical protein